MTTLCRSRVLRLIGSLRPPRLPLLLLSCAAWAAALAPHLVRAADTCCRDCGQAAACRKVCRLVCEEKTVEVTCWGCRQEDFCLPLPGRRGCRHRDSICDACRSGAPCTQGERCDTDADDTCSDTCPAGHEPDVCSRPKWLVWFDWCPRGARVHTKTKLLKKVVEKKIPTYRYVVEDVCATCLTARDRVASSD